MIKVAFVRGAYLNNFEGQNYKFSRGISMQAFSSLHPLSIKLPFPVTRLPSLTDLPFPQKAVRFAANRCLGDAQVLFGLEKHTDLYDIFHTADPHYYYSYQAAQLRSRNKIRRLLVTSWETIPFNNEKVAAKKKIKKFVLARADRILCYTSRAKEALITEGISDSKIVLIPLGIDLSKFHPPEKKNTKFRVFLFVGRLVPEKGVWDVYEAYKLIRSSGTSLRIVGDGPLRNSLTARILKDGLKDEVFIQRYEYEDMADVYRGGDVFILPSKHTETWEEQYGMVLPEAMATGLPVVAYKTGSIPEIVGNAGGILKEGDVGALSRKMLEFTDPQINREIGTMGIRRVKEKFDARKTSVKISELYKSMMKKI